jgi:hypothetical protein
VQSRQPLARHGEKAEGIVGAQIVLRREGQALDIREPPDVGRRDAGGVEGAAMS